jgi:hypothetical protein
LIQADHPSRFLMSDIRELGERIRPNSADKGDGKEYYGLISTYTD